MDITSFSGEYDFLSNFYEVPVSYTYTYGNAEAAYQAQKAINRDEAFEFIKYPPGKAKRMGRKIKLRPDWEDVKLDVMRDIVFAKFFQNPELASRLLATGDRELVEGNDWHDTFWGVDLKTGAGQNNLGKILMELREELKHPEIKVLDAKKFLLTRFAAPEVIPFDWFPPQTTFTWSLPSQKEVSLSFERLYKIYAKAENDAEEHNGIKNCIWHFRGRMFNDLDFLRGDVVKTLYEDYHTVQKIKQSEDGKKFFYQADRIPTFDEFDDAWDNINEFAIFRDDKGVNMLRSQHGWKIPSITVYVGLKNSDPSLDEIFKHLE